MFFDLFVVCVLFVVCAFILGLIGYYLSQKELNKDIEQTKYVGWGHICDDDEITNICPNCKEQIDIPKKYVGQELRCKYCKSFFTVYNKAKKIIKNQKVCGNLLLVWLLFHL